MLVIFFEQHLLYFSSQESTFTILKLSNCMKCTKVTVLYGENTTEMF